MITSIIIELTLLTIVIVIISMIVLSIFDRIKPSKRENNYYKGKNRRK